MNKVVTFFSLSIYFSVFIQISLCDSILDRENNTDNHEFFIVSGYPPRDGTEKYIVSVRYSWATVSYGNDHICGGSIVAPKTILTAAHCLSDLNFYVVAGSRHRLYREAGTRIYQVRRTLKHPEYKTDIYFHDIGFLYLKKPVEENGRTIAQIPLASQPTLPGTSCVVLGWGRLFIEGPLADELQQTAVTITSFDECKRKYQELSEGMMCAGDEERLRRDACIGDSGGPLICNGNLVGVISFGRGCGIPAFPGVYSDVSYYRDWIDKNISMSNQFKPNLKMVFGSLCIIFMAYKENILKFRI